MYKIIEKEEIFKDIPGYDGVYQVSNYGTVKSLKYGKKRIRKPSINNNGYLIVGLHKDGKRKTYGVHVAVAMAFLEHAPDGMNSVVDHIDNNRLNNHVFNLQIISNRENSSRGKTDCGVYWSKRDNKWRAQIKIGDKTVHLGRFIYKQDGLNMYQKALENMHLFDEDNKEFRNMLTL